MARVARISVGDTSIAGHRQPQVLRLWSAEIMSELIRQLVQVHIQRYAALH
jgi:hypothetical protein